MAFAPPRSLSPSKVTSFTDCALAFRFRAIERLPEPSSPQMVKGTLVHAALEGLFWHHLAGARTEAAARDELLRAWDGLRVDPEFTALALGAGAADEFVEDAAVLVANYFRLQDPNEVRAVGVELTLEARLGDLRLRGIIDRLDLTPEGELVVVDYKTGRAPPAAFARSKLAGVHLYAVLCRQVLGRPPVRVELLHLREPTVITAEPTEQSLRGHEGRVQAVWTAIERACREEDFRPRSGPLCNYCAFRDFCPAFGGDPSLAAPTLTPAAGEGAA